MAKEEDAAKAPRSKRKVGTMARRLARLGEASGETKAPTVPFPNVATDNKVAASDKKAADKRNHFQVKKKNSKDKGKGKGGGKGKKDPKAFGLDKGDVQDAELEAIVFGRSAAAAAVDANKKRSEATTPGAAKGSEPPAKKLNLDPAVVVHKERAWFDADDKEIKVDLNAQNRTKKLKRRDGEKAIPGYEYEKRLRAQFVNTHGSVTWTKERAEEEPSDSEDEEAQHRPVATSARLVAERTGGMLKPQEIDIKRLKNVPVSPGEKKGPAAIQSVQFHPTSELMLSAGMDKRLHLFSVDGDENTKLSSHFFKNFPIFDASFTPNGDQVIISSESRVGKLWSLDVSTGETAVIRPMASAQQYGRFHGLATGCYPGDMPGLRSSSMFSLLGDNGTVIVCDVATKHPIRTLRMRTPGVAAVFSTAGDTLFTADSENNLYEWDLGSGRCLQRVQEMWATKITRLAMSRASAHSPTPILAVGTASGNIDLFDAGGPRLPKEPTSTIDNLVTSVSCVRFHPSGEMMAASSRLKKESLKLMHTRTSTVFQNWPLKAPLQRVSAIDFSRRDGLMAIGNEQGRILVYQLAHFLGGAP